MNKKDGLMKKGRESGRERVRVGRKVRSIVIMGVWGGNTPSVLPEINALSLIGQSGLPLSSTKQRRDYIRGRLSLHGAELC